DFVHTTDNSVVADSGGVACRSRMRSAELQVHSYGCKSVPIVDIGVAIASDRVISAHAFKVVLRPVGTKESRICYERVVETGPTHALDINQGVGAKGGTANIGYRRGAVQDDRDGIRRIRADIVTGFIIIAIVDGFR